MSNPIRIKGVLYDSLSAACRAYGVMLQTVLGMQILAYFSPY